ncbi:hypothetical protein Mapa_013808 [Marchantia paleacea]|nr:hypothetical protein Mapa_013808 [Marchantia paleacea]
MKSHNFVAQFLLVCLALWGQKEASAYDPSITTDFGLIGATSGEDFTSRDFEPANLPDNPDPGKASLTPNYVKQFPGVTGLGVSSVFYKVGAGGLVPPHLHPRGTELFFVLTGTWSVGFIDTKGVLFKATLTPGDQFIFPQGMVHYQFAVDDSATGYSVSNTQDPGVSMVVKNLFSTNPSIPSVVMQHSLGGRGLFTRVLDAVQEAVEAFLAFHRQ